MRVLSFSGEKGGVGKSTLAASVSTELHQRGFRTLAVDLDQQQSLLTWASVGTAAGSAIPPVIALGDNVRQQLPAVGESYDIVVLDCPGRAGRRVGGALLISDLVLFPAVSGAFDVWAMGRSLEMLEDARSLRDDLKARIVINGKFRAGLSDSVAEGLAEEAPIPLMNTQIGRRVVVAEAIAAGSAVTLYRPGSVAANEMKRLVDEIEDLLGLER